MSWHTNLPQTFQFHFNLPSTTPAGAHQSFAEGNMWSRLMLIIALGAIAGIFVIPLNPAGRHESKSEGGDKPQPEAEGRSR